MSERVGGNDRDLVACMAAGDWVSGEQIAASLGLTRAAIWKRMRGLESLGFSVNAERGRGYQLSAPVELLDEALIRRELATSQLDALRALSVLWQVDSTNRYLAEQSETPSVCVAEMQTSGRGRRGRRWHSPPACNIYLSLAWQFERMPEMFGALGLAVGVITAETLQSLGYESVALKWPNDLYANQRKLCGILIEHRGEADGPVRVVIGIGMNVLMNDAAPESVDQPWVSLSTLPGAESPPSRNLIVGRLVNALMRGLGEFESRGWRAFAQRWSAMDLLEGRDVSVDFGTSTMTGTARGLDETGALKLETSTGVRRILSGDVSVRPSK